MTDDFDGQVVIVTGAASGIGRSAAELLAARGARLVLGDLDDANGAAVASAISEAGGDAVFCTTDVSSRDDAMALVERAVERYGRLDGAFNNAGISEPLAALTDLDPAVWQRVLDVNLSGVAWCLQAELRRLVAQGDGGAIVNTASGAAVVPAPLQPSYTAAKHGVVGLTKLAAQEYASQGIRVNAVLPGTTDTPMLREFMATNPGVEKMIQGISPTGALGTPDEIAQAAVWLLSPAASYVNGQSLLVDGGAIPR